MSHWYLYHIFLYILWVTSHPNISCFVIWSRKTHFWNIEYLFHNWFLQNHHYIYMYNYWLHHCRFHFHRGYSNIHLNLWKSIVAIIIEPKYYFLDTVDLKNISQKITYLFLFSGKCKWKLRACLSLWSSRWFFSKLCVFSNFLFENCVYKNN